MANHVHFFKGTGRLVYDPKRPGMKKRTRPSGANTIDWWCILQVDREITRYYRWWVNRHKWGMTAVQPDWLCQPSWDAHISVVRGERIRPEFRDHWKAYDGEIVNFEYAHYPFLADNRQNRYANDGDFWMVDVRCQRITEIRGELGLRTHHNYHLTVGRTYDVRLNP